MDPETEGEPTSEVPLRPVFGHAAGVSDTL
jgi:hypothetical protein